VARTTKKIDRLVSTPLFTLPFSAIATGDPPIVVAQRNLLRHVTCGCRRGRRSRRRWARSRSGARSCASSATSITAPTHSTPLWHYVNAEADLLEDGERMGPVGGRIVAEVLVGLLELDPQSFLSQPGWRPTLAARYSAPGEFRMIEFLTFAGVAPT
jgi:hypothetical protein